MSDYDDLDNRKKSIIVIDERKNSGNGIYLLYQVVEHVHYVFYVAF